MSSRSAFTVKDHPKYAEWRGRDLDLQRQRNAIASQLEDAEQRRVAQRDPSTRHAAAVALVDGQEPEVGEAVSADAEVRALSRRLDVFTEAVKLSKEREREVTAEIAKELKPTIRAAYTKLLQRIVPVVTELGRLAEEEAAFRRGLETGGIPITSVITASPLPEAILSGQDKGSLGRWLDRLRDEYPEIKVPEASK